MKGVEIVPIFAVYNYRLRTTQPEPSRPGNNCRVSDGPPAVPSGNQGLARSRLFTPPMDTAPVEYGRWHAPYPPPERIGPNVSVRTGASVTVGRPGRCGVRSEVVILDWRRHESIAPTLASKTQYSSGEEVTAAIASDCPTPYGGIFALQGGEDVNDPMSALPRIYNVKRYHYTNTIPNHDDSFRPREG